MTWTEMEIPQISSSSALILILKNILFNKSSWIKHSGLLGRVISFVKYDVNKAKGYYATQSGQKYLMEDKANTKLGSTLQLTHHLCKIGLRLFI